VVNDEEFIISDNKFRYKLDCCLTPECCVACRAMHSVNVPHVNIP
jgi:hypothetical protein